MSQVIKSNNIQNNKKINIDIDDDDKTKNSTPKLKAISNKNTKKLTRKIRSKSFKNINQSVKRLNAEEEDKLQSTNTKD